MQLGQLVPELCWQLVPELCSGTPLCETLFRVEAVSRDAKRSFARAVPKREFGNQEEDVEEFENQESLGTKEFGNQDFGNQDKI